MASGAPEAAELVHLRRTAQVQARQIAELQDTLAAQGAYVERIESARVMKLLHTLMRLLGREPRAGSARRE